MGAFATGLLRPYSSLGLSTTPSLMSVPDMLAQVGGLPKDAPCHLVRFGVPSLLAALVVIVIEMAVSRICDVRLRLDAERADSPGVRCVRCHCLGPPRWSDREGRRGSPGRRPAETCSRGGRSRQIAPASIWAAAASPRRPLRPLRPLPPRRCRPNRWARSVEDHRPRPRIEGHRGAIRPGVRGLAHPIGVAHALETLDALRENAAAMVRDLEHQPELLEKHRHALLVQAVLKRSGRHGPGLAFRLRCLPERADRLQHRKGDTLIDDTSMYKLVIPQLNSGYSPPLRQHAVPQLGRHNSVAKSAARLAEPHGSLRAVDEGQHPDLAVDWQQHERLWLIHAAGRRHALTGTQSRGALGATRRN
eukprot:scaffold68200_cov63-Phaeocystis_antarctica.AAC.4